MLSLPALNLAWSPASHPAVGGASRAAVCMQYNSPFPDLKLPNLPKPPVGLPELDLKQLQKLASPDTQRELQKLAGELRDLAQSQDPQVVLRRSLDLARALQTVGSETLEKTVTSGGAGPPPVQLVLRRLCEELGATYVKLGQFVASSPTLFPPEYVAEFQQCLDQTPPMDWSVVEPLIEKELGQPISAVFSTVEHSPLASASIAQVHEATLLSGERVVIKVQKVGVEASLQADLDLMYATARTLEILLPLQDDENKGELSDLVGELRRAILEEVDFRLEAQRTTQFADFLARQPELAGVVTVPKVYPEASAGRILTLEFLDGSSLTDLDKVRQFSDSPELALIAALNTWVSSVLYNEWFHADVHAGNLLILRDGRVAFIDFGIVGAIPPQTASAMVDFIKSYAAQDYDGLAVALSQMGFTRQGVDTRAFAADLREVLDSVEAVADDTTAEQLASGAVDETQLNRLVAAIAKVAGNYGIKFPREFALLVKQVLYFDRYTRLLAPDLDILADERLATNNRADSGAGAVAANVEMIAPAASASSGGGANDDEDGPVITVVPIGEE